MKKLILWIIKLFNLDIPTERTVLEVKETIIYSPENGVIDEDVIINGDVIIEGNLKVTGSLTINRKDFE
jgi:hypothetical protein